MKKMLIRKINIKSLLIIIFLIPVLFILIVLFFSFIYSLVASNLPMYYKDKFVLKGYYKKDERFQKDGFRDYTDYCKYFYKKENDDSFINNGEYKKVKESDVLTIKRYFKNTKKWMDLENRFYDFDDSIITIGDYYYLDLKESGYNNYNVYFYDIETHILYYIHSNT